MEVQQPETKEELDPGGADYILCNTKIYSVIASSQAIDSSDEAPAISRTELDSHANMPVVGKYAYVIADTGKTVDVNPFTPDYDPIQVKLVDAAIQYDSPHSGESTILVIRNTLSYPSMNNNLIPLFILREAGITVNEIPKIHVKEPTEDDHAIIFPDGGLRIPLYLEGVFSYFKTCKPTYETLMDPPDVYVLTPETWNPHSDVYANNEASMMDWQGNMKPKKDWEHRVVLEEVEEDEAMAAALNVSEAEGAAVNTIFTLESDGELQKGLGLYSDDPIACEVASISPATFNAEAMYNAMKQKATEGIFKMSIGSTHGSSEVTVETVDEEESLSSEETDSQIGDDDLDWELDFGDATTLEELGISEEEMKDFMSSSASVGGTTGRTPKGVDPEYLSKIWRISVDEAKRTIDATSQHVVRPQDPTLSRNFGTNDRMLRYKRIKEHFFMDTFFATKNGGKSTRGNTCCQLFVTDKGYVYVVPMRSKSEVPQAVRQFAKEVGAPEAIICDPAREQVSREVKKFCNDIGSAIRALEEGTQWSNRAELYIGLIKEAVRKDMREANSPLCLWDYCVERRARINNLTAKDNFKLQGTNAYTSTAGEEGDISNLCQYKWYDWCYFCEQKVAFPDLKEQFGRVLGHE